MAKEFKDHTRSGKVRPWDRKKIANLNYAELLKVANFKKAHNVKECGEVLNFLPAYDGYLVLYQTWFCHSRLCPLCSWRKSMKDSSQVSKIVDRAIEEYPKGRFLFLTLTIRNSYGDKLKDNLRLLSKAFNKLIKYKKVRKHLLGFIKAMEITINDNVDENGDIQYHPHLHSLIFVSPSYFKGSDNYISQKQWTEFWKRALKVNYRPIVNVKIIKPQNKTLRKLYENDKNQSRGINHSKAKMDEMKAELAQSAKETAKYPVKDSEYITGNSCRDIEVIKTLESALSNTRSISYGKLFKEIRSELKLDDTNSDNADLVNTGDDEDEKIDKDAGIISAYFNHEVNKYCFWNWKNEMGYSKYF